MSGIFKLQKQNNFASPSKRFFAFFVDNAIVFFVRYIIFMGFFFLWYKKSLYIFMTHYAEQVSDISSSADNAMFFFKQFFSHSIFLETVFIIFILFLFGSIYWVIFPATRLQATPGKLLMNIQIVNSKNGALDIQHAIRRYLTALVPWFFHIVVIKAFIDKDIKTLILTVILITLWYEPSFFGVSKRSIHDILARTKVVKKPTTKKKKRNQPFFNKKTKFR